MLEETDEKIFHQNMVLQHLVDHMAMVEYLTDAGDELENGRHPQINYGEAQMSSGAIPIVTHHNDHFFLSTLNDS